MNDDKAKSTDYCIRQIQFWIPIIVAIIGSYIAESNLNISFTITGALKILNKSTTFLTVFDKWQLALFTSIFYAMMRLIINRFSLLRKQLEPVEQFKGVWIEECRKTERVISVCSIYYNYKKKRHSYGGWSFTEQGDHVANWHANHVSFNNDDNRPAVTYLGKGNRMIDNNRELVDVTGTLYFQTDATKSSDYTEGYGFYVDFFSESNVSSKLERIDFDMKKITCDIKKKLKWNGRLKNARDAQKLAMSYINYGMYIKKEETTPILNITETEENPPPPKVSI